MKLFILEIVEGVREVPSQLIIKFFIYPAISMKIDIANAVHTLN